MRNGFSETLDKILRQFGMMSSDVVGYVVTSDKTKQTLLNLGYNIKDKIYPPVHGFIYLDKYNSSLDNVLEYLTKLDYGCIIVFRINDSTKRLYTSKFTVNKPHMYEFGNKRYFGAIVKGI